MSAVEINACVRFVGAHGGTALKDREPVFQELTIFNRGISLPVKRKVEMVDRDIERQFVLSRTDAVANQQPGYNKQDCLHGFAAFSSFFGTSGAVKSGSGSPQM